MNLKSIALIALSLALAGCGNKGPLVQAAPPPAENADAETAAPAETVPVEVPVEAPATEAPPAEEPAEVPATDAQDG